MFHCLMCHLLHSAYCIYVTSCSADRTTGGVFYVPIVVILYRDIHFWELSEEGF